MYFGMEINMKFLTYDSSLSHVETSKGTMTLSKVFFPFFIEYLLLNLMSTINTIMLSGYSDEAVAAVGAATQVVSMILTLYTVISNGSSIVINHNLGAGNEKAASDAAFTSLIFCASLSIILGLTLSAFAKPIMVFMNLEADVEALAVTYFRMMMTFSAFIAITSSISSILRSYGRPKVAVAISLLRNILIALFDYIVIYRPINVPVEGVFGIACASVFSNFIAMLLIIIVLKKANLGLNFRDKGFNNLKIIKKILKVGVPSGISSVSYNVSQVVSTSIIAILGTVAISSKIYVSNIVFYVYVLGMSLGISTSLLVGWMVGAGKYEQAYKLNQQNLKITLLINLIFSVTIYFFGTPLLSLFTSNEEIIAIGKNLMLVDIFVEIGRGFNHIEENSLKGAGDVVFPMIISIISCWLMSVLFSYILGIKLGLGLTGCWIAFGMDEAFRGINIFL